MQLTDYAQALGAAQRLVPSYNGQRMDQLQIQQQQLQNRQAQQQIAAVDAQDQEHRAFQSAFTDLGDNPSADKLRMLGVRFPSLSKGLNEAVAGMEKGQRQQIVSDTAQIHAALTANRPDLAKSLVQRHIDADKAAGKEPDPEDTALIGMIDSGDKQQISAAKGMLYATLAAADPDSAAKTIGEYGAGANGKTHVITPGGALVDDAGKELYRAAPAEDNALQVPVYDDQGHRIGTKLIANGGKGGDPSSTGTGAAVGSGSPVAGRTQFGWTPRARNGGDNTDAAVDGKIAGMASHLGLSPTDPFPASMTNRQVYEAITLSEGGRGSLADTNNNRGNLRDPKTLAYRKFGDKNAGDAAGIAQVARNRARGQNTIQTMVEGLPVGRARGAAPAGDGGYVGPVASNPNSGYRLMTPAENQAANLDPNVRYQISPQGQVTALGGQSKAQLKPLPPKAAEALITNNSSLRNIDAALALLNPRNQSNAAKQAQYAIGTSNRFLPDAVLQHTNPDGVSFRAQIGQIGGLIIKDISGAAVSASEDDRLAKWVPLVTDTPQAARAKLLNLRRELLQKNDTITTTYGEDQGYRQPAQAKAPPAVGSVVRGYRFNGGNPANPNSWSRAK